MTTEIASSQMCVKKKLARMEATKGFVQIPARYREELLRDINLPSKITVNDAEGRIDSRGRIWAHSLKARFSTGNIVEIIRRANNFQIGLQGCEALDSQPLTISETRPLRGLQEETESLKEENGMLNQFENWRDRFLNRILQGDSAVLLKEIPPESVSLVVTSPPYYKQRDYGGGIGNERTVEEYLNNVLKVFHECVRVTRRDGSIVFNLGDKYEDGSLLLVPYRFTLEALKRERVKLINTLTWVKLNPTPRQFNRRLVSSTEPFFHFVKSDSYYYNIDTFMSVLGKKEKGSPVSEKLGHRYFQLIEKASLSQDEKKRAREELRKVIQEVKTEKIAGFRMKIRGIHAPAFGGQEGGRKIQMERQGFTIIRILGNNIKRDVIECPVETIEGSKHPAIYPEFIVQELIKLLTRPNDIVLDPFVGSGTTAVAAKKLGREFIGVDINPDYCKYAEERVKDLEKQVAITEFV